MKNTQYYRKHSLLRIFLSYFKPHMGLFVLDILCATFASLVDLTFPLLSRRAINQMLPAGAFRTFFLVMGIMGVAYLIRGFLYFVIGYWGHTFGIRVEADIRRDLFRHMQSRGNDYYDRNRTGQLMSRLTSDLFEITELAHHGPEDLFISIETLTGVVPRPLEHSEEAGARADGRRADDRPVRRDPGGFPVRFEPPTGAPDR